MTCEDCVHNGVCSGFIPTDLDRDVFDYCREGRTDEIPDIEERCFDFKPKSRYIELPCAVGGKVYWINRVKNKIETDIVVAIHLYGDGSLLITTETIGTKCASTYSLNRFLEIMHFTKEEAEKALENKQ